MTVMEIWQAKRLARDGEKIPSFSRVNQFLLLLFLQFALTGFVCTHKIQAEDECLSSKIICYECDSRYDPNCADPFEFPPDDSRIPSRMHGRSLLEAELAAQPEPPVTKNVHQTLITTDSNNNNNNSTTIQRQPKKFPPAVDCHGCCVKLTSKTPDGSVYVKRTCTSNLQINYFMVGLVCMRESGDRGKMCFCENDYCNGSSSSFHLSPLAALLAVALITLAASIGGSQFERFTC